MHSAQAALGKALRHAKPEKPKGKIIKMHVE